MRLRAWIFAIVCAAALSAQAAFAEEPGDRHPLDPLSAEEIREAVAVLRGEGMLPAGVLFPILALEEPRKEEVRAWRPGRPVPRRAFAVLLDRGNNRTEEAVVDLRARRVVRHERLVGVQPAVLEEEFESAPAIVKKDPRWQAAMRRRGLTEWDKFLLDAWAPGQLPAPAPAGTRLLRVLSYYRGDQVNPYGRPVEGVVAVVDMNRRRVVEVVDTGVVPVPERSQDLDPASVGPLRAAPKALRIEQPDGPSFDVRGHEVRWQGWRFRWALHPREGLVLHTVGWEEGDRVRSILYRASVSEMVVPYGDPDETWVWRNAFDEGEYGLGRLADELLPGRDVPENAVTFDADFAGDDGTPYTAERVVALYERDGGLLWKHFDYFTEKVETRRGRELVLEYIVTIGNYDYGLHWIFRQDGTLELEVLLTGIMLSKGVPSTSCETCPAVSRGGDPGAAPTQRFGRLVAKNVVAPNHQHFFNVRLDFDVGGPRNSVLEKNVRALPREQGNEHWNAFLAEESLLRSERGGQREVDLASHRTWKVVNPSRRNALGHLVGYALVPGENSVPYMTPDSPIRKRGRFVDHHLWLTRYRPREDHAAGYYPNQGSFGEGLPRWTCDDEPLVNEDVVLWYTFGVTHTPRAEDWPVMPVHRAGFRLIPDGFFSRNPALDVPAPSVAPP